MFVGSQGVDPTAGGIASRRDNVPVPPMFLEPDRQMMAEESKIDHVGIAVNSLEEAVPLWRGILGESPAGREEVEAENVRVAFFGEGTGRVELLEPTAPDSAVARHLERRGEGVHHVCLRVGDLEGAVERAVDAGAELIPPGVREGAGGHRVAFLHPRTTGGVLLELSEPPSAG